MGRKQKKLPIHYCSRTSTTLPPPLFFSTFERKREGKKETAEKQRGTKVPPPTPLYCLPWCFPFKEMINEKNTIIGFAQINSQHPEKNSEICFIIQKEKKKKKKKREKKFSPFFFFFFFFECFYKNWHSNKHTPESSPRVQFAFKILMIRSILQFTLRIAFRCALHHHRNQDIRCWK